MVVVGEPGCAPARADPLVTVSIPQSGTADPTTAVHRQVLQARAGSLSIHGTRPAPLTVGGRIGEYVTGAYAALAAATRMAARVTHRRARGVDVSMLEAIR